MARPKSFAKMSLEALVDLRDSVSAAISEQAENLRAQLAALTGGGEPGNARRRGRPPAKRGLTLKGRTVAPKYRDKHGNTWSGRGAEPRWMRDAIKGGAKRDDFLIGKPAKTKAPKKAKSAKKTKAAKKRRAAKGRRATKKSAASKPVAAKAE